MDYSERYRSNVMRKSNKKTSKPNFHYARGITPKHATSGVLLNTAKDNKGPQIDVLNTAKYDEGP